MPISSVQQKKLMESAAELTRTLGVKRPCNERMHQGDEFLNKV
jgi:hypothetical protein